MLRNIVFCCIGSIVLCSCTDAQVQNTKKYIPVDAFTQFEEIVRDEVTFEPKNFENTAHSSKVRMIHGLDNTAFHFYNAVALETEQQGLLVGGTGMRIRSTLDGGKTWKDIRLSRFANAFHSTAIRNGEAFTVGEGSFIVKSDASFSTWSVFDLKDAEGLKGDSQTLYKIKFTDSLGFAMGFDTGFGIARPLIVKTQNGGDTWSVVTHAGLEDEKGAINDFDIVSENLIYMVTQMGNSYKSTDGGTSWTKIFEPKQDYTNLNSVAFKNQNTGFISGISGLLYATSDGGDTWNQNTVFKDSTKLNISDIQYITDDLIAITTAESFVDEEKPIFSYLLDGNGQNETPRPLLTKKDSAIFFEGDAFHLFLMDKKRLFLTDRNNTYSLDAKTLSLE